MQPKKILKLLLNSRLEASQVSPSCHLGRLLQSLSLLTLLLYGNTSDSGLLFLPNLQYPFPNTHYWLMNSLCNSVQNYQSEKTYSQHHIYQSPCTCAPLSPFCYHNNLVRILTPVPPLVPWIPFPLTSSKTSLQQSSPLLKDQQFPLFTGSFWSAWTECYFFHLLKNNLLGPHILYHRLLFYVPFTAKECLFILFPLPLLQLFLEPTLTMLLPPPTQFTESAVFQVMKRTTSLLPCRPLLATPEC